MQDVCFYRETELNLEYNFRLSARQAADNYLYKKYSTAKLPQSGWAIC